MTRSVAQFAAWCTKRGIAPPAPTQSDETRAALRKCNAVIKGIRELERMARAAGVLHSDIAVDIRDAIDGINGIRRAVEAAGRKAT